MRRFRQRDERTVMTVVEQSVDAILAYDPNCLFCPANGRVDILAETSDAYLVKAINREMPACYLIIPKGHCEHLTDLPETWQVDVVTLLWEVPWYDKDEANFNLSYNQGRRAGQRVPHVHAWVIPRFGEDDGLGAATAIARVERRQL